MMLPADSHVHSERSWDAPRGSMERSCVRAVELGLSAIVFGEPRRPKARMDHDSDCAALIHQHVTRDAEQKIADALSARVKAKRRKAKKSKRWKGDDEETGVPAPTR